MQGFRLLLLPFSWIYSVVVALRNWLYNRGIFSTYEIPGAAICIGNITVGGTGKSPLTAYLAKEFNDVNPVILSRGYGRKTTGLVIANEHSTATEIGDEPMMYWQRFQHKVPVVVAEKRKIGIEWIQKNYPKSLILLDDAFQHRAVSASCSIVLMTYDRLIYNDYTFPAGNLRESAAGLKRASLVLVTKCPVNLSTSEKQTIIEQLKFHSDKVFFSTISYGLPFSFLTTVNDWKTVSDVIIISAIADPSQLISHFSEQASVHSIRFADHHTFDASDIQKIQQKVANFVAQSTAIVITEKDAVKLDKWKVELAQCGIPIFIQPMEITINNEQIFKNRINDYVASTNERSC
jgi:tetraacyldisaccharide 4'-kinase